MWATRQLQGASDCSRLSPSRSKILAAHAIEPYALLTTTKGVADVVVGADEDGEQNLADTVNIIMHIVKFPI